MGVPSTTTLKTIHEIRHQRLLELIEEAGSVSAFAKRTGRSISQVSQLKSRTRHSSSGRPRVVGEVLARELEAIFGKPLGWMDVPPGDTVEGNVSTVHAGRKVPVISLIQAGLLRGMEPASSNEWVTAWHSTPSANAFALKVEGDSMVSLTSPSFPAGTIIIVDPARRAHADDYVVARDPQNRPTFRQLVGDGASWYLRPLNQAYPTVEIDDPDMRVIGTVIEYLIGGKL